MVEGRLCSGSVRTASWKHVQYPADFDPSKEFVVVTPYHNVMELDLQNPYKRQSMLPVGQWRDGKHALLACWGGPEEECITTTTSASTSSTHSSCSVSTPKNFDGEQSTVTTTTTTTMEKSVTTTTHKYNNIPVVENLTLAKMLRAFIKPHSNKEKLDGSTFHYNSIGEYLGFGCVRRYSVDGKGSSVGQFANHKEVPYNDLSMLDSAARNTLQECYSHAAGRINKLLCGRKVTRWANVLQGAMVKACSNSDMSEDVRLIQGTDYVTAFFNLNAATRIPHTEMDASYTLIGVPKQKYSIHQCCFNLHLNKHCVISIPMGSGCAIYYHGYLLTHQQSRSEHCSATELEPFVNVSAHCNKGTVENCRKSLSRK